MSRKYFFILETLIGFAALVAIDFFAGKGDWGFAHVSPHPYWIVVLLIASRYGTLQGVFAGSCGAVLFIVLTGNLQAGAHASFPHGPYLLPFFFILAGGVLGEVRSWHKKMHDKLQKQFAEKSKNLDELTVEHEALLDSKIELDKRIAFQSTTMVSLFEKLTNLEQLQPEQLYQNIPDLLADQLNVTMSSVYLVNRNKLEVVARKGSGGSHLPDVVDLNSGMMGEVVRTKGMVTINHMLAENDEDFHSVDMIMSAPILRKDETLLGVINIEKIPFFDYNGNTVRIFEVLAYWVSIVADQSMQFQRLMDRNIADEITGAYNYTYFKKRLRYEIARARRFHSALSLMLLRIRDFNKMLEDERKNVLVVLNWIFDHVLREVDIIAKHKDESTFAIILPAQDNVNCDVVLERLHREVENYALRPFDDKDDLLEFEAGISTLQSSEGSLETLLQTAEERLEAGGQRQPVDVFDDIHFLLNRGKDRETPGNGPTLVNG